MRTLDKNKTDLFRIRKLESVDKVDSDGNYTGEKEIVYSEPYKVSLSLYPVNGDISGTIKGIVGEYDYIGVTNDRDLQQGDLLFIIGPKWVSMLDTWSTSNEYWDGSLYDFGNTYDYTIGSILKSLNTSRVLLKARV